MKQTRITRMVELLSLLQAGRGHNVNSLATACGVSRRTIFRDLNVLKEAGVPLQYDEELERYFIPSTYFLPPTNFTAEEALAVIALCHEMGGSGRLPFYESARSAALKLEGSLPSRIQDEMRSLARAIRIQPPPVNRLEGRKSIYEQLVEAVADRHAVRINYESFSEMETFRTKLFPYQLLFSRRSWYVVARSSLHRQTRTFNLGRISDLQPLSDKFKIPRGFSIERYLRNAWHLIPESGPDQKVVIRFQPLVARNVAEVLWHKNQRCEFRPDGTMDFHVKVSGLGEISWWILGYGDQAEVLKPAALRKKISDRAEQMLSRYNGKIKNRKRT